MTENPSTIATLSPLQKAFLAIEKLQAKLADCEKSRHEPIAVIGMACRFPGRADSPEAYWEMLQNGVDAVGPIPERRWRHEPCYDPIGTTPGTTYVNAAAFLDVLSDPAEGFDADFFGIPPREANLVDPQHRLLLELAYEALEHAGIPSRTVKDSNTGVFIGIGQQDYLHLVRETGDNDGAELYIGTGNGFCFASGRLSYLLGLQGPSFSLDTACSSSLVAVHQACLSLRAKECDLALTGGVQLMLSPAAFVLMSGSKALAKDGRCKPFDAAADGYGRGEGGGMVALKRWSDAVRDGDRVIAVIRGSSVDHDGRSSGLTVPNGRAQQALLKRALSIADMAPEAVLYVEAHGTGTSLGDPIEVNALAEVLRKQSDMPLLLGSVKSNIGHLEAAAGIAGLIKLALAVQKGKIPPSLHFNRPNPAIPWQDMPLRVVTTASDWPEPDKPRVGLVSSFGLSGTNSQVIIEQAAEQAVIGNKVEEVCHLFKLSAKTPQALRDWVLRHGQKLAYARDEDLADICYTANVSRDDYDYRLSAVVKNIAELQDFLQTAGADGGIPMGGKTQAPVFLFSGEDAVNARAGLALFETQPVFKAAMLACDAALVAHGREAATAVLYGAQVEVLLTRAENSLSALFALQYALAKMWMSWGVMPGLVLGHGVGEYAAACIAGVFDVDAALELLCTHGFADAGLSFSKPRLRFVSTASGNVESVALMSADYWRQRRSGALFSQALDTAAALDGGVVIALGALPLPAVLGKALPSLKPGEPDWLGIQQALASLYQQGAMVDWAAFYEGRRKQLTSLPTYPWQRKRYWFKQQSYARRDAQPFIHPLLEHCTQSPLLPAILHQGAISCARLPFLSDHRVFDRIVVAGACHLSAALAAARSSLKTGALQLRRIEFIEALVLSEQEQRELHIALTPTPEGTYALKAGSVRSQKAGMFVEHAAAVIVEAEALPVVTPVELERLKQQCGEAIDVAAFYRLLEQQHVVLGDSFRWFAALSKGRGQALARMRAATGEERAFGLPPGLIDACFQLLGAAVPEQYTDTYIPLAINQWLVDAELPDTALCCHARLDDEHSGAGGLVSGDVELFGDDGRIVARFSGVTMRKADTESLRSALTMEQNLHATIWRQAADGLRGPAAPGRWLSVGRELARQMADRTDWVEWVGDENFVGFDRGPVDGVLFCLEPETGDVAELAENNAQRLLAFLQRRLGSAGDGVPRMAVLTRQSRTLNETESGDPAVALIAGLIRSFNHEYPNTPCRWLDTDSVAATDIVSALRDLPEEAEIILRNGQRYVPRLQRLPTAGKTQAQWRGRYLITGGTGALGFKTAQWLAAKGISEIVLMSRKPSDDAAHQIDALRRQGVSVDQVYGDVADAGFVNAVVERYAEDLRGVIHAAGVLQDGVIANLTPEHLQQVLRPKVAGLWNLHQASLGLTLDCFIAYSSVAALLGAPGQGNYAAANSFLDEFIAWRRSLGLPGLSINWGPWAGGGMASVQDTDGLAYSGIGKLSAEQAFATLEQALRHPNAQVGIFSVDWAQFALMHPTVTLIRELADVSGDSKAKSAAAPKVSNLSTVLAELPMPQRERYLRTFLSDHVRGVLGITAGEPLASDKGFAELGMDSLMSLELKNRLQQALDTPLPSTLIFKYPSVDDLYAFLATGPLQPLFAEQQADDGDDIALLLEQELLAIEEAQKR